MLQCCAAAAFRPCSAVLCCAVVVAVLLTVHFIAVASWCGWTTELNASQSSSEVCADMQLAFAVVPLKCHSSNWMDRGSSESTTEPAL